MNPIEQFERERDERIKSFEHNQSLRKADCSWRIYYLLCIYPRTYRKG